MKPHRRLRRRWWLLALAGLLAMWGVGSAVAYAASLRVYMVPTGSMVPTFRPGDHICAEIDRKAAPERGEIWVLHLPRTMSLAVKRVIGLPGETIEVKGGRVRIDGQALDEPYLSAAPNYTVPPTQLGPDEYYVLGDNRNAAADSHVWGPVTSDHLLGRVRCRCWPPQRVGGL